MIDYARRARAGFLGSVVLTLTLARAPALSAQTSSDASSTAVAVQLFDEAERLVASGNFAEACPKYAESYRLDPQLGVLLYLAECYEKNNQLASAWGTFREAEEIASQRADKRSELARSRAASLAPRLSHVLVSVPKGSRAPGMEVLRDGVLVAEALWGTKIAVDTGSHRIEARAPNHKPWSTAIEIRGEGTVTKVEVPLLGETTTPETNTTSSESVSAQGVAQGDPGSGRRITALALGGVGIVGIGVGGFFGLSAQSTFSDSNELCNAGNVCTEQGVELRDSAQSKALVATVATGIGVAALAGAAVLWFTAPRAESPAEQRTSAKAARMAVRPHRTVWGLELSGDF